MEVGDSVWPVIKFAAEKSMEFSTYGVASLGYGKINQLNKISGVCVHVCIDVTSIVGGETKVMDVFVCSVLLAFFVINVLIA